MTDILIRGKDLLLPERSGEILDVMLFADGTIQYGKHYGFAFELPEHGDLIDRSKLSPSFVCSGTAPMETDFVRRYYVDRMPAIVPQNKEDAE